MMISVYLSILAYPCIISQMMCVCHIEPDLTELALPLNLEIFCRAKFPRRLYGASSALNNIP